MEISFLITYFALRNFRNAKYVIKKYKFMTPYNPFLISGYYSPEYFCDRVDESEKIICALENGRNITLVAPRRMGKTGLIKNVFHKLKENQSDIITIYIDIYSTRSLNDFVNLLANNILGVLDTTTKSIFNRVSQFIKSCKPVFTLDEQSGNPKISIEVIPEKESATLKEIFDYLGSSEKRCYIAIDEFQQISEYDGQGTEALLRSYIQFLPNVNFIFSGSKQHIMQEMFLSAKRPFYQSTQILSIGSICSEEYYKFSKKFFELKGIELLKKDFEYLYSLFDGHTWYIQSILNRLYSYNIKLEKNLVDIAIKEIVSESVYYYESLLSNYTANNISLIKAISKEGCVSEINSSSFITKHKLKAASSVNTSLSKLIRAEMVYKSVKGYIVYDKFMNIWLSEQLY